jgi:hypothetical protein
MAQGLGSGSDVEILGRVHRGLPEISTSQLELEF